MARKFLVKRTKKIGGKIYKYRGLEHTKKDSDRIAKFLRKHGWKVRIFRKPHFRSKKMVYYQYTRK